MESRITNSSPTTITPILKFVGAFLIAGLILSLIVLFVEFSFGNGDGIWFDLDIRRTTFSFLSWSAVVAVVVMLLFSKVSYIRSITFSILTTLILLFGIEKLCRFIISMRTPAPKASVQAGPAFERIDWKESAMEDDILGVKAKPNLSFKWAPVHKGIAYDSIHISTDQFSRRITPRADSLPRPRYAMFLGCSYTYGDGVSDNETLPYYFQKEAIDYQSYNYGFLGYSPLHALARLQKSNLKEQMPQQNGFGVFTLINDHLDGVIPASRWIEITKGRFPYLNESTMQTDGTFDQRRRLYTTFVTNFQSTGLKEMLRWGYPRFHTPEHEELLAKIIVKARDEYVSRFQNQNFYVIIFPGNPASETIIRLFKEKGIQYFDYSKLIDLKTNMLGFDNAHPKAVVYQAVAHKLVADLNCRVSPAH